MAELLIKAIDAVNDDPELDRGCYKRGDVVVIMPDGHPWGREEGPPKFMVLSVPGLDDAEAMALLEEERREEVQPDVVMIRQVVRRRKKALGASVLAAGHRAKVTAGVLSAAIIVKPRSSQGYKRGY